MNWVPTGEYKPDGRPIWHCPVCKARVAGERPARHGCGRKPVLPVKYVPAQVPCRSASRGERYARLRDESCGCMETVYACSLHSLCTINPVTGDVGGTVPQCCLTCENGGRPESVVVSST